MSWRGYERQWESARAIRAEVYDIASALAEREDNVMEWLAQSYIMYERLNTAAALIENLQEGLGRCYDDAPKEAVTVKDDRGVSDE